MLNERDLSHPLAGSDHGDVGMPLDVIVFCLSRIADFGQETQWPLAYITHPAVQLRPGRRKLCIRQM